MLFNEGKCDAQRTQDGKWMQWGCHRKSVIITSTLWEKCGKSDERAALFWPLRAFKSSQTAAMVAK